MSSMIDAIHNRISVRTYTDQPVDKQTREKLLEILDAHRSGPFGNTIRFELIDLDDMEKNEIKNLGTYGIISGARLYIASAVADTTGAMEDTGYCFEKVILAITSMGLGTCWMGGTFKRASFAERLHVAENEIVPIVTPVGYPHDKRSIKDRAIRRFAKSDKRKDWHELFFIDSTARILEKEVAGDYSIPLECVRIGPSASNMQPWRLVKETDRDIFHLLLKRTRGYHRAVKGADLQLIDMGIAMCHFELAAQERGLEGRWEKTRPELDTRDMEYIISWVGMPNQ